MKGLLLVGVCLLLVSCLNRDEVHNRYCQNAQPRPDFCVPVLDAGALVDAGASTDSGWQIEIPTSEILLGALAVDSSQQELWVVDGAPLSSGTGRVRKLSVATGAEVGRHSYHSGVSWTAVAAALDGGMWVGGEFTGTLETASCLQTRCDVLVRMVGAKIVQAVLLAPSGGGFATPRWLGVDGQGVFAAGWQSGSIDFPVPDGTKLIQDGHNFIYRYRDGGTWVRDIRGSTSKCPLTDVRFGPDSYATVQHTSACQLSTINAPGPILSTPGSGDHLAVRYDASGRVVSWAPIQGFASEAPLLVSPLDGGVLLSGASPDGLRWGGHSEKFDPPDAATDLSGFKAFPLGTARGPKGNVYAFGFFTGQATVAGQSVSAEDPSSGFVVQLHPEVKWVTSFAHRIVWMHPGLGLYAGVVESGGQPVTTVLRRGPTP